MCRGDSATVRSISQDASQGIQKAINMRTITVNVSDPVYDEFQRAARAKGRPTSELIREAMENYRRAYLGRRGDLTHLAPISVGTVLEELGPEDDLLDEMLEPSR